VLAVQFAQAGVKKEIQFPRGSTSAVIEESVIRGEQDFYYLTTKAGQTMEVVISSLEKNAVFSIYKPGYTIATDKDGFTEIKGESLPRAGETDDAMVWKGKLTVSGKYLIVVGGTRGNATYKLKVTIH
jgi:hypothetical protein